MLLAKKVLKSKKAWILGPQLFWTSPHFHHSRDKMDDRKWTNHTTTKDEFWQVVRQTVRATPPVKCEGGAALGVDASWAMEVNQFGVPCTLKNFGERSVYTHTPDESWRTKHKPKSRAAPPQARARAAPAQKVLKAPPGTVPVSHFFKK